MGVGGAEFGSRRGRVYESEGPFKIMFLDSKTGNLFVTKWHHMEVDMLLTRRISIICRRASFWTSSSKFGLGLSWKNEMRKNSKQHGEMISPIRLV